MKRNISKTVNLDDFDFTQSNILLQAVNAPMIIKESSDFSLFRIYYYNNIGNYNIKFNQADPLDESTIDHYVESMKIALLYSEYLNGNLTSIFRPSVALQGAILNKKNAPIQVEEIKTTNSTNYF